MVEAFEGEGGSAGHATILSQAEAGAIPLPHPPRASSGRNGRNRYGLTTGWPDASSGASSGKIGSSSSAMTSWPLASSELCMP